MDQSYPDILEAGDWPEGACWNLCASGRTVAELLTGILFAVAERPKDLNYALDATRDHLVYGASEIRATFAKISETLPPHQSRISLSRVIGRSRTRLPVA